MPLSEVEVRTYKIDLGTFPKEKAQEYHFLMKNAGAGPLVIQNIRVSCGCTKVKYPKEPILPGREAELVIRYEAEEAGYFNKVVDVHCNVAGASIRLLVTGNAK